jgi:hypothetical protein
LKALRLFQGCVSRFKRMLPASKARLNPSKNLPLKRLAITRMGRKNRFLHPFQLPLSLLNPPPVTMQ